MQHKDRIFHNYKCIFIHVPKTGGSSINRALHNGEYYAVDHQLPHDLVQRRPKIWNEYFTFAFIRNPWDRFVSAFLYNTRTAFSLRDRKQPVKGLRTSLLDFNYNFDDFIDKTDRGRIVASFQFRPQTVWLWSQDNKPLNFNFIGRYEKLQEDFDYVCEQLGLEKTKLSVNNASPRKKHYTEYYNDKTREIIEDMYKTEIEYFNYKFGE